MADRPFRVASSSGDATKSCKELETMNSHTKRVLHSGGRAHANARSFSTANGTVSVFDDFELAKVYNSLIYDPCASHSPFERRLRDRTTATPRVPMDAMATVQMVLRATQCRVR